MALIEKELDDVRYEMFELKKKLHCVSSENQILKVKLRKLQNELDKKNMHMEALIDPKKSTCIRKILTERGATLIVDLKKRNTELVQAIEAKDVYIRKIKSELQTSNTYLSNKDKCLKNKETNLDLGMNYSFQSRSLSSTSSEVHAAEHLKQNIEKIKLSNKASSYRGRVSSSNISTSAHNLNSTKSTSTDKISNDFQHEESNFEKLLKEMENMKEIVSKLSLEQENTKKLVKDKNRSIKYLARQVKHLQKKKSKKSSKTAGRILVQITNDEKKNEENLAYKYSQENFEEDITNELNDSESKEVQSSSDYKNNDSSDDDEDVETGDSNK